MVKLCENSALRDYTMIIEVTNFHTVCIDNVIITMK